MTALDLDEYSPDWMDRSACKDLSPAVRDAIFFPIPPDDRGALLEARKVCWRCPVFVDCWKWSAEHWDQVQIGTYAGVPEGERNKIDCGLARFRDWRPSFSLEKYAAAKAKAFTDAERRAGRGGVKSEARAKEVKDKAAERRAIVKAREERRKAERPPCPACAGKNVYRNGKTPSGKPIIFCYDCKGNRVIQEEMAS